VITSIGFDELGSKINVAAPLKSAHAAGAQVAGSGITFTSALNRAHSSGAQITSDVSTPGAPNKYSRPRPRM
jgi:non-reducing end alpha-L-arabinofuranosidase